jgi:phage tail sheath protein FI
MLNLKAPGVYTQVLDSGVRSIVGAPTSVALFIGPTRTGIDLMPQRIANFGDFERLYGGLAQSSLLSYSVLHFFGNGGGEAFVMRVPPKDAKAAQSGFNSSGATTRVGLVRARSSGASGNNIYLEFDSFGLGVNLAATPAPKEFNLTVRDRATGRTERFGSLTTVSGNARTPDKVLNDPTSGSGLVSFQLDDAGKPAPAPTGTIMELKEISQPGIKLDKSSQIKLQIEVLDKDGKPAAGSGFEFDNLDIFASGEKKPLSRLELLTRMVTALNVKIQSDPIAKNKMQGLTIEGTPLEGGKYARLQISAPDGRSYSSRIADAVIKISKATASGTKTQWLDDYTDATFGVKAAPARLFLGAKYENLASAGQVDGRSATDLGDDGDASGQPSDDAFLKAVQVIEGRDPFFNTLCLPDLARAKADDPGAAFYQTATAIYAEAARICERKFAFLIVDPPPEVTDAGAALGWKTLKMGFQSSYAGAWFPNIRVADPLVKGAIRSHPPSGAVAGLIARLDGEVGVWQAPAGTDASINGAYGPALVLSDDEHGLLNPVGLNCIRQFPIYGTVGFGSRTVDGADLMASEWKYVPVRRTSNYILRTLSDNLRWAVHKPNGEELWSQLRISVNGFMAGLFRQGAFKGTSSRDAYFVRCDANTTTATDIDIGIVNIVIGFAPLKPAEFVVVSLRQITQPAA